MIIIRPYKESDATSIASIYYHTIHHINKRDYTEEQLHAWAPKSSLSAAEWKSKWKNIPPLVATIDKSVVGFAALDIDKHFIDCFFVHHEYQNKGVGTALMKSVLEKAKSNHLTTIWSEVSITAQPFFKSRGFRVKKEQLVVMRMIEMKNFVMEIKL